MDNPPVPPPLPPTDTAPLGLPARPDRTRWWIATVAVLGVLALTISAIGWVTWLRPGPGPVHLVAGELTSESVLLSWRPPPGRAPQQYVVRRDGADVATVAVGSSYRDARLSPLTAYHYRVLAVVHGRRSQPSAEIVVDTLPASPQDLAYANVTDSSVELTWRPPPGPAPERYHVLRDDTVIGTVEAGTLSYTDDHLHPLAEVTYTVVAVTRGRSSPPSTTVSVSALPPPIAQARLTDAWDVALEVTKNNGTRLKVGEGSSETWTFTPQCAEGPCAVSLAGSLGGEPFTVKLARKGGAYSGTATMRFARCGSVLTTNKVTVTLSITQGEVWYRQWLAADWKGTLVIAIPYTRDGNYYCPRQGATFSVTPDSAAQPAPAA